MKRTLSAFLSCLDLIFNPAEVKVPNSIVVLENIFFPSLNKNLHLHWTQTENYFWRQSKLYIITNSHSHSCWHLQCGCWLTWLLHNDMVMDKHAFFFFCCYDWWVAESSDIRSIYLFISLIYLFLHHKIYRSKEFSNNQTKYCFFSHNFKFTVMFESCILLSVNWAYIFILYRW